MLIDVHAGQATVTDAGDLRRVGSTWVLAARRLEDRAGGGFTCRPKTGW